MKLLEERILKDGIIKDNDVLKVDAFLNHQCDVFLYEEMAKEWKRLFSEEKITKILTIEASGIGIAAFVAKEFGCPMIFAKKSQTKNISGDIYTTKVTSYTHGRVYDVMVSRRFLNENDTVLIIDDFLANGAGLQGLIQIVNESGAKLAGAGIAIEKAFQPGGKIIRDMGVRVESLAKISVLTQKDGITFCD